MTQTIKGGAYRGADGTWHDANGKPLPAHVIQQLEEQERQQAEVEEQPDPTTAHYVAPTETPEDAYLRAQLEAEPVEQPAAKPKRTRKTTRAPARSAGEGGD